MRKRVVIGLDFGTASARGTILDVESGRQEGSFEHPYRHGVLTAALPDGRALAPNFALQVPADYLEAAEIILRTLADGRDVAGIGIDFTASSPMPTRIDGTSLVEEFPGEPHAYVKLWKHGAAQIFADEINARHETYLADFGGAVSGEGLLAKAAELAAGAPELWRRAEQFIEAGDWLVWQLTGNQARSLDFASYKAQFSRRHGYPNRIAAGLAERLAPPHPAGTAAGRLSGHWRNLTGIGGDAWVAVAAIDSHVVLPAVRAAEPGVFLGALGTSAGFLFVDRQSHPRPKGFELAAHDAVLPGLWCCEAGQAAFGDTLGWFVRTFPRSASVDADFESYNAAAALLPPGAGGLIALDWFGGNRIPLGDSMLSGLLVGLTVNTTAPGIYRSLVEGLCFGTRSIYDGAVAAGIGVERLVFTNRLASSNAFLIQTMADIIGRPIEVVDAENPTAIGAAIHGAVCAGVVADFAEAAERFGVGPKRRFRPDPGRLASYDALYRSYRRLAEDKSLRDVMRMLRAGISAAEHLETVPT